jgi:lysine 6-dehydrogenase
MYDWGIMRNDKITVNGAEIGILDCIGEYLFHSKEGQETELYGYSLHVEVIGTKDGKKVQHVLYHTHPASDGSVPGWEKLRAYTRNVGIPMAIATELIAKGRVKGTGVLIPEEAFNPAEIFAELEKRGIHMHEEVTQLGAENESMSVIL